MRAKRHRKRLPGTAATFTALVTAAVLAGVAHATVPGENGKIVFASDGDIYSVNPDRTALRPLTNGPASEHSPAVSPDGERIAYVRDGDIWLMNIDGGEQAPIAQTDAAERMPAWSPDGTRIAFVSGRKAKARVHVMTSDGSGQMSLVRSYGRGDRAFGPGQRLDGESAVATKNAPSAGTPGADGPEEPLRYAETHPAWSPDGRAIAFSSTIDGDSEIYVQTIGAQGPGLRGARKLTSNDVPDGDPTFSPDGLQIAYTQSRFTEDHDRRGYVWMTPVDGTGTPTRLTPTETEGRDVSHNAPAFSPDGTKLVYYRYWYSGSSSDIDGGDLYLLDLKSKTGAPLIVTEGEQRDPSWQPLTTDAASGQEPEGGEHGRESGGGNAEGPDQPAERGDAPRHDGCTIRGTPGDDVLIGTPGRDVICGLGGDDVIRGLGGNDLIKAGAGDDIVKAGPGKDRVLGQAGDDELWGQGGRDIVKGGRGDDELYGNKGADRLYGQAGDDSFYARRGGQDLLKGGNGQDEARADQKRDRLRSIEHLL